MTSTADRTFLGSRRFGGFACALLFAAAPVVISAAPLRITEIHYHPKDDAALEYVELANVSPGAVDIRGWSFTSGIRAGAPGSLEIPSGGTVVFARDPEALRARWSVPAGVSVFPFSGALDNDGERLRLVDGFGLLIDEVRFRDGYPFPTAADGAGESLHLRCEALPGEAPFNWSASAPTPGVTGSLDDCALAPIPEDLARSPVVINEINYHPEIDVPLEYIEFVNRTDVPQDIGGWSLDRGVSFVFAAGTVIPPGEFVLVAQDPPELVTRFGLIADLVHGPFADGSTLSDGGETVRLVDALGSVRDEVSYNDAGAWPALADGLGGTLQRVQPLGPSDAPGNWRVAPVEASSPGGGEWLTFELVGLHEGPRFYFYLLGEGEVLLDAVELFEKDGGELNYFPDHEFDAGLGRWRGTGNHETSVAEEAGGFGDDGPCARIRSTGNGDGFQNALRVTFPERPPAETPLVLRFRMKHLSGTSAFIARSSVTREDSGLLQLEGDAVTGARGVAGTPLASNEVGAAELPPNEVPPTIRFVERSPLWAAPEDDVTLVVRIEGKDIASAAVQYQVSGAEIETLPLRDDGELPDAHAGDGLWSAAIPPAPDDSLVWYSFEASTSGGAATKWPRTKNPISTRGYYVSDHWPEPAPPIRLFHIFTPGALSDLSCNPGTYRSGVLVDPDGRAYRSVGVKFRGETACSYPKKPLRVRFNKGDQFEGQSRLNFNAGWNDKSMLREQFAFDLFRDAGVAYSETHMAEVRSNGGRFHGAFFTIEDPREDYLRRNRLDPSGGLYKARNPMLSSSTGGYEPRNDAAPDLLPEIGSFAGDLNRLRGTELIEFLNSRLHVEGVIDYQAVQAIITDGDSVVKNWLLYYGRQDLAGDGPFLVTCFPWDVDLTFGQMLLTTDVRVYNEHPLFQTQTYPFHDQGYHGILNALLQRAPDDYYIKAFYGRIWHLVEEKFQPSVLGPKIDAYDTATADLARRDLARWRRWGSRSTDSEFWRDDFRLYVSRRTTFLRGFLTRLSPTTQGRRFEYEPAPRLEITEIHYNPDGEDVTEFLEIVNRHEADVDLAGWTIPAIEFTFPPGAVATAGEVFLVARDPGEVAKIAPAETKTFGPYSGRLSNGGEIVRLRDDGEGGKYFPELIDSVVYLDDGDWPDAADGEGASLERVGLDVDNDEATSWRAGWSPGVAADANASPVARITASTLRGAPPLTVLFDATGSSDAEGDALEYRWTIGGESDSRGLVLTTFNTPGTHAVILDVTDEFGASTRATVDVVVGDDPRVQFRRGDANADGGANVADAVYVLEFLFADGDPLLCAASGDVDGDGGLTITDAIALLNFLFGTGRPPEDPVAVCGVETRAEPIGCDRFPPCE